MQKFFMERLIGVAHDSLFERRLGVKKAQRTAFGPVSFGHDCMKMLLVSVDLMMCAIRLLSEARFHGNLWVT